MNNEQVEEETPFQCGCLEEKISICKKCIVWIIKTIDIQIGNEQRWYKVIWIEVEKTYIVSRGL
jgi:hypothetical protein